MEGLEDIVARLSYEEALGWYLDMMREDVKKAFDGVRNVVCVQPHPDDADVAAGGTIAKLARRGVEVTYVTLTDGRLGSTNPENWPEKLALQRRREQEEAAKILGVKGLIWLNYRDGELQPTLEARWELVRILRRCKPDMVMAPDPWLSYEVHPDHRSAGILASEAAFFASIPHAAPGALAEGLRPHTVRFIAYYWTRKPNVVVDVSDCVEAKMMAVRAHKSQFGDSPAFEDLLKSLMRLMGKRIGASYGEAFKVLNLSSMHCNVFAEDI